MARIESWWTIEQGELLDMLRRCAAGESPDMVISEGYANGEHEVPYDVEDEG